MDPPKQKSQDHARPVVVGISQKQKLCRFSTHAFFSQYDSVRKGVPNFHGGHLATNYQNYDWGLAAKFSLRGLPAALGFLHHQSFLLKLSHPSP